MNQKTRGFEIVSENYRKNKGEKIQLPTRGSEFSAGYDFYSPVKTVVPANGTALVWSDIKSYMQPNEVLMLYVRSSVGIKKGLALSNGTGIIDKDYFNNESNDGNIGVSLRNMTNADVVIEVGERICQGIFIPFLVADNGNTDKERCGGIGSTN